MPKLTYIDLFSGAGGLSLGFSNAGFKNLFSIDIEPSFCENSVHGRGFAVSSFNCQSY